MERFSIKKFRHDVIDGGGCATILQYDMSRWLPATVKEPKPFDEKVLKVAAHMTPSRQFYDFTPAGHFLFFIVPTHQMSLFISKGTEA